MNDTPAPIYNLISLAAELGVTLTDSQSAMIYEFGAELERVNQTMNLTRIPASEYITAHIIDSLTVAAAVDCSKVKTVLDIGTGAGFPAVPLAIAFPHLQVTAMDARNKKLLFIQETAEKIGIKNIRIEHARAEQLAAQSQHQLYDLVCSRALAAYETLLSWQLPFVARGGYAVMLKSVTQREEIATQAPEGWTQNIKEISLPGTDLRRLLVILRQNP